MIEEEQALAEEEQARLREKRRWIERHPVLGYRLTDTRPTSVDAIRDALNHATEIKNSAQGPGAPAFEQAQSIIELLRSDLQIALTREAGSPRESFWTRVANTILLVGWMVSDLSDQIYGPNSPAQTVAALRKGARQRRIARRLLTLAVFSGCASTTACGVSFCSALNQPDSVAADQD